HRFGERHAEALPVVKELELGAYRLRNFLSGHRQAGRKRVTRTKGSADQVYRLWELFLEFPEPPRFLVLDVDEREECGGYARADAEHGAEGENLHHQQRHEREASSA